MPVLVSCDSCSGKYRVPDQHAGKRIKCPKCSAPVTVPVAAPEPVAPADKKTVRAAPRKPAAETVKSVETPLPKKKTVVARPKPPEPEPEPEMEPVSQAAPDDDEEEQRPRKEKDRPRKKKRKKRQAESDKSWMWWAGGVGAGTLAAIVAMIVIANSGHKEEVIVYLVKLAIMVPISTVILIISMFIASALGGGIDFGAAHTAVIKTICLLTAVNIVGMIPFGSILVFPIWLLGLMYLFGLDLWECRFLIFINYMLNWAAKMFIVAMLVGYILHGKGELPFGHHLDEDPFGRTHAPTAEDRAVEEIDKLGGDVETAEEKDQPVVKVTLAGTAVTDDKLAVLKSFPKLRQLDLSKTAITDAGLAHLKELPNLAVLDLTGTKVTKAGIQELKKARPTMTVSP